MAQLLRNFLSESPMAQAAREVLLDAFDQGWHDPLKLSQGASKARTLRHEAQESIAARLMVDPSELEFLGEPYMGHFLAIQGLAKPSSHIVYSSVDRKEVQAVARTWPLSRELHVSLEGRIDESGLSAASGSDLLALQAGNGETGVLQDLDGLTQRFMSQAPGGRTYLDFTSVGIRRRLPVSWDCALFDARAWNGPAGLGILAIKNGSPWRNPLPHVSAARSPQSFSLPLLIASAVALESWHSDEGRVRSLSHRLRHQISSTIPNCDVAGDLETSMSHINSFSFLYVEGEELLRSLEKQGFLVDSGSACTAEDLQPSHVLAAMGLLTHGNIRITIHEKTTEQDIDELAIAIRSTVEALRT